MVLVFWLISVKSIAYVVNGRLSCHFFNDVTFLVKNYQIIYNWYIFYRLLQVLLQTDEWHMSHYIFLFCEKKILGLSNIFL